jgi:hypothetical protein
MNNPLFPRITVQEAQDNFDFVMALVERGTSFYIEEPDTKKTCILMPVNDPVAQIALQQPDISEDFDDVVRELYSTGPGSD